MRTLALFICLIGLSVAGHGQTFYGGTGHYYELVVSQNIGWTTSYNAAAGFNYNGMPGHLATVTSQGENDFIIGLISVGPVWIGGFQAPGSVEPAGGWGWITGETWSYTNWGPGEPNNNGGPFGNEDKLAFGSVTPGYSGWGDLPNSGGFATMRGYVVEFEPAPEPLTLIAFGLGVAAFFRRSSR